MVWSWLTGGHNPGALVRIAMEPFQVGRTGFLLRGGDVNLMDALDPLFRLAGVGRPATDTWELLIATVLCAGVFYYGIVRSPHISAPVPGGSACYRRLRVVSAP